MFKSAEICFWTNLCVLNTLWWVFPSFETFLSGTDVYFTNVFCFFLRFFQRVCYLVLLKKMSSFLVQDSSFFKTFPYTLRQSSSFSFYRSRFSFFLVDRSLPNYLIFCFFSLEYLFVFSYFVKANAITIPFY